MKSAEYFDTHRVEILALYNANGTSQTIIKDMSMPFCRGLLDRWLCENVPREERLKHRHRIMSAQAKGNQKQTETFFKVVKYPKDGPGCKPKLCGNCQNWHPRQGARGRGPRMGLCDKHDVTTDRCDFCPDEPPEEVPFLDDGDADETNGIDPVTGERFYGWERKQA